jgi:hypothetical protein
VIDGTYKSFATLDLAGHGTDFFTRFDQLIVEPPMIFSRNG